MKVIMLLIAFILSVTTMTGQYQGGIGDGATFGKSYGFIDGSLPGLFSGGTRDGHDFAFGAALSMSPGCDLNITMIDGPINSGDYSAENNVTISGSSTSGTTDISAGYEIIILPTFEVMSDHIFQFDIGSCLEKNKSHLSKVDDTK